MRRRSSDAGADKFCKVGCLEDAVFAPSSNQKNHCIYQGTIKVLGGVGEATLLQKDPSPTNQFKVTSFIYQKPETP